MRMHMLLKCSRAKLLLNFYKQKPIFADSNMCYVYVFLLKYSPRVCGLLYILYNEGVNAAVCQVRPEYEACYIMPFKRLQTVASAWQHNFLQHI